MLANLYKPDTMPMANPQDPARPLWFKVGPQFERDPLTPGDARLKRYQKGSALRGGRSYMACSIPVTTVGAGATVQVVFNVQEDGYLGWLAVNSAVPGDEVFITSLQIRGDELVSGDTSVDVYQARTRVATPFGHFIDTNTRLTITFRNDGAAAVTMWATFTLI